MELRRHTDDHVIVVGIEVSAFRNIESKRWVVVIASQQVIRVVDVSWTVGSSLGEVLGPESSVSVLGVVHGKVWRPDSVMNSSLSEVPLLEEVAFVLLVARVDFAEEDHLVHEFPLFETLVDEQVVFFVDGSVAALAGSNEHLESSS